MFSWLDPLIDGLSMYRLMLYYLGFLVLAAISLSFFGDLQFKPLYIAGSALILIAACWLINLVFANIFKAPVNGESSIITALILTLIITPNPTGFGITFLLAAAGLAMASKYLLTINKKHIFNPAAIAVVLTALGPQQSASWWVGTAAMLPFVLIGGVLVMRKIKREKMVISFLLATALSTVVFSIISSVNVLTSLQNMVLTSAVFFLGFVMLTEPLTSPTTSKKQTWYAILVGVLLPPQVNFLNFYITPEIALVIGNAFSYIISPKVKLFPVLQEKFKIATNTADFIFRPDRQLAFLPGQYMEWTLPHEHTDARGSRRYFTLASSPTEPNIRIGVKFYDKSSSFKEALLDIDAETPIVASQIAGDFVMPEDKTQKLAFIAGGIGVTPFRSMIKYLLDQEEDRDVAMLYAVSSEADIAYKAIFEEARKTVGLRLGYVISTPGSTINKPNMINGVIDSRLIQQAIPDYRDRIFYISGTHSMVKAMHNILINLGVSSHNIKLDFFPGYV